MKKYYLVRQWCPHRGQDEDHPDAVFFANKFYEWPLNERISTELCYGSMKRAERVAVKYNTLYSRADVVEVPAHLIYKEVW